MSAGIYRIINTITNDHYIGYSTNLKNRFNNYKIGKCKGQTLLFKSFEKYGYQNHVITVLFESDDLTINLLKELEMVYIRYYKYWIGRTMLNSNDGGGGSGVWSIEKKEKFSKSRTGFKLKEILQYDFNGNFIREWPSLSSASKDLNIDYNLLIRCCKGTAKSVGGYRWQYKTENYPKTIPKYIKQVKTKPILQYDVDGNFIREWKSIKHACDGLNIHVSEIYRTMKYGVPKYNKQNNTIKHQFKYKEGKIAQKIEPLITVKILQYDIDGNFIRSWNSTTEIEQEINLKKKNITHALRGETQKAFDFQWKYSRDGNIALKIDSLINHDISTEKPIKLLQYGLDGSFIKAWTQVREAAKTLGISANSIRNNIRGKLKTAGKFQWRYGSLDEIQNIKPIKIIQQFTLDGKFVGEWTSFSEIESILSYNQSPISNNIHGRLKQAYGYTWKYKDQIIQKIY